MPARRTSPSPARQVRVGLTQMTCTDDPVANLDRQLALIYRGAGVRRAQVRPVVVASVFEKRMPGLYHNTAVVIERDGSAMGVYRTMHIPDDPLYYEKFYFTPGDTGFRR